MEAEHEALATRETSSPRTASDVARKAGIRARTRFEDKDRLAALRRNCGAPAHFVGEYLFERIGGRKGVYQE
jgi:hypothetical protein